MADLDDTMTRLEEIGQRFAQDESHLSLWIHSDVSWLISRIEKLEAFIGRVQKTSCDPIDQNNCLACDAKQVLEED